MGRPSKFKREQVAEIINLMKEQTVTVKEKTVMKITDEEMCSILCASNFKVSISYVKRLRQTYGISARNKDKFFDDEVAKIHAIIKQYVSGNGTDETVFPNYISYVLGEYCNGTNEPQQPFWKMTVSDAAMAEILKEAGYDVNAKYVERTRRSLGIKPFQERLPQGQRQRLLKGAFANGGDILAVLHEQAVLQLSIYRSGSCNMYGTAGVDTYTQGIGAHTLGFDDAIEKKEKRIQRLQKAERKRRAEELNRTATALAFMLDHDNDSFGDVVAAGCYSRGRGGARRSQHDAQVYQSIY